MFINARSNKEKIFSFDDSENYIFIADRCDGIDFGLLTLCFTSI